MKPEKDRQFPNGFVESTYPPSHPPSKQSARNSTPSYKSDDTMQTVINNESFGEGTASAAESIDVRDDIGNFDYPNFAKNKLSKKFTDSSSWSSSTDSKKSDVYYSCQSSKIKNSMDCSASIETTTGTSSSFVTANNNDSIGSNDISLNSYKRTNDESKTVHSNDNTLSMSSSAKDLSLTTPTLNVSSSSPSSMETSDSLFGEVKGNDDLTTSCSDNTTVTIKHFKGGCLMDSRMKRVVPEIVTTVFTDNSSSDDDINEEGDSTTVGDDKIDELSVSSQNSSECSSGSNSKFQNDSETFEENVRLIKKEFPVPASSSGINMGLNSKERNDSDTTVKLLSRTLFSKKHN